MFHGRKKGTDESRTPLFTGITSEMGHYSLLTLVINCELRGSP